VHDSGGERVLLIDTADRLGVPLPVVSDATGRRLGAVLDPGLEPANPVDAWGTGRDAEAVFTESLLALADDEAIGAVVFCIDLTTEELPDDAYSNAALAAAEGTTKPVAVLTNLATTVDPIQAGRLRASGVPVLEGTETGLRAVGHILDRHRRSQLPPLGGRVTGSTLVIDPTMAGEAAALRLLADYGIPTPVTDVVGDVESALDAARRIGYPLVMKTAESIDHKTEALGVVLGIRDEQAAVDSYLDLAARLGPRVTVSEQIPAGVELALGMIDDEQFGPVVIVSAGGTLIEMIGDRVALLPRVDKPRALAALDRLRIRPLLDGVRGAAPVDCEQLVEVIVRFSELALDAAGEVGAFDVNPLIAGPDRVVAVDGLVKWRQ
jgi:acyl-CoA synthetase (NDP forming)